MSKLSTKSRWKPLLFCCAVTGVSAGCAIEEPTSEEVSELETQTEGPDANYPWVVKVVGDETCQGVLINERQVLTAGHCVDATPHPTLSFRRTDPNTGLTTSGATSNTSVSVKGASIADPGNDLAIVTMSTPLRDRLLVPAELPLTRAVPGETIVVASTASSLPLGAGMVKTAKGSVAFVGSAVEVSLPVRACVGDAGAGVIRSDGIKNYVVGIITDPVHGTTTCGPPGLEVSASNLVHQLDFIAQRQVAALTGGFRSRVFEVGEDADFLLPSPYETIVGDFDGDGKRDYGRLGSTGAYFYRHQSGFTTMASAFQSYEELNFTGAWKTVVGDFNGDGRSDYARLDNTGAWVYYAQGNFGGFARGFFATPPSATFQLITGDFNGDGRSDIARLGDASALVYYGNASGSFTRQDSSYNGLHFGAPSDWDIAVGDFDGDSRTDYARLSPDGAFVYYGRADKTFGSGFQDYGVWSFDRALYETITGDFNGDGKGDYARITGTKYYVFLGQASGFTSYSLDYGGLNFGAPSSWKTITADFNGDGKTDFARLGDSGGYFFYASSGPPFRFSSQFQNFLRNYDLPSPLQVVAGDFDGNGKGDYIQLTGIYEQIFTQR